MELLSFTKRHSKAILALAVALGLGAASSAQAGTIFYPDIVGNGFHVTNISESNDLAGTVALYGMPSLTPDGHALSFDAGLNPFTVNAANGGSAFLRGVLNFTVVYDQPPTNIPNLALTESGNFTGLGNAYATVTPFMFLFDQSSNLIGSVTGTITPPDPLSGGAFTWSGAANVSGSDPVSSFNVTVDNDLSAVSIDEGSFAQIDKKLIKINICDDCGGSIPEPASLGVLGLGGMALLLRGRRK